MLLYILNSSLLVFSPIVFFFSIIILIISLRAKRLKPKVDFFPKVSVVVWFWKGGNIIERKIKNLLSLSYPKEKYEIIIVDNHSNDETEKVCKIYEKKGLIKFYKTPKQYSKKAFGLDEAIKKLAKNEIIAITDPDGICEKDWLKKIVQPFKNPNVAAVAGMIHCGNYYENLLTKFRAIEDEWFYNISTTGTRFKKDVQFFCGANYAVRKSSLEAIGLHGKKTLVEDYETSLIMQSRGMKIEVVDANVWQEEVSTLKEYYRQRIRWYGGGAQLYKKYGSLFVHLLKKKPLGTFLLHVRHSVPLLSFASLSMFTLSLTLKNTLSILINFLSFLNLNVSLAIGLMKFRKKKLIKYVPLYLVIDPILILSTLGKVFFIKKKGKTIEWKSLGKNYYHRGVKLILD
ncbi:MAG: glycosyltransferase family 2 protein [Candidatus Aenigmarchaeota archaeon]|nr:glycosyltransferase family 2 protein [Candidatus Aenigmarchaeota archaeon]